MRTRSRMACTSSFNSRRTSTLVMMAVTTPCWLIMTMTQIQAAWSFSMKQTCQKPPAQFLHQISRSGPRIATKSTTALPMSAFFADDVGTLFFDNDNQEMQNTKDNYYNDDQDYRGSFFFGQHRTKRKRRDVSFRSNAATTTATAKTTFPKQPIQHQQPQQQQRRLSMKEPDWVLMFKLFPHHVPNLFSNDKQKTSRNKKRSRVRPWFGFNQNKRANDNTKTSLYFTKKVTGTGWKDSKQKLQQNDAKGQANKSLKKGSGSGGGGGGGNFKNQKNDQDNQEDDDEEDEETTGPSWVRAIQSWVFSKSDEQENQTPSTNASPNVSKDPPPQDILLTQAQVEQDQEKEGKENKKGTKKPRSEKQKQPNTRNTAAAALGSIVNVEALLFATGSLDLETDGYERDVAMRTLVDAVAANGGGGNVTTTGGRTSIMTNGLANNSMGTSTEEKTSTSSAPNVSSILPVLEQIGVWDAFVRDLFSEEQQQEKNSGSSSKTGSSTLMPLSKNGDIDATGSAITSSTKRLEEVLRDSTKQIELFINEASAMLSPSTVQELIVRAAEEVLVSSSKDDDQRGGSVKDGAEMQDLLENIDKDDSDDNNDKIMQNGALLEQATIVQKPELSPQAATTSSTRRSGGASLMDAALKYILGEGGSSLYYDTSSAAANATELAKATTRYTVELVKFANDVLVEGYFPSMTAPTVAVGKNGGLVPLSNEENASGSGSGRALLQGYKVEDVTPLTKTQTKNPPSDKSNLKETLDLRQTTTEQEETRVAKASHATDVQTAAKMAKLSGAIYEKPSLLESLREMGHSFVANGTASDVAWLVTDSLVNVRTDSNGGSESQENTVMTRTVTIRGFDATDGEVDRLRLLDKICAAEPRALRIPPTGYVNQDESESEMSVPTSEAGGPEGEGAEEEKTRNTKKSKKKEARKKEPRQILAHSGLLGVAEALYKDIRPYIVDGLSPHGTKIVLTGHSIGGSLSIMLLMLLVQDFGAEFTRDRVMKVFTFGSPPVSTTTVPKQSDLHHDSVLDLLDLPESMVDGYIQPWDPIVRLFSEIDGLYPLVDDLGEDGVTLYASGPPRTLRPITRAILESWGGWPTMRETRVPMLRQNYTSVGRQHLLLPEPIRYLTDRLTSVNLGVPPVEKIARLSSHELLPALNKTFPLDTFSISFVPAALRSFIHHFYPAYTLPLADMEQQLHQPKRQRTPKVEVRTNSEYDVADMKMPPSSNKLFGMKQRRKSGIDSESNLGQVDSFGMNWADAATSWILGVTPSASSSRENELSRP